MGEKYGDGPGRRGRLTKKGWIKLTCSGHKGDTIMPGSWQVSDKRISERGMDRGPFLTINTDPGEIVLAKGNHGTNRREKKRNGFLVKNKGTRLGRKASGKRGRETQVLGPDQPR